MVEPLSFDEIEDLERRHRKRVFRNQYTLDLVSLVREVEGRYGRLQEHDARKG